MKGKPLIIPGMKPDTSSDTELLQAMRAGDEEAVALYRRRGQRVRLRKPADEQ
ncbi:MAG: hypothetical protein H0T77_05100 [Pyrinomonadaceae bacterium]|nr:hypothetical protein [Pyrinomonadaceae bacterium]